MLVANRGGPFCYDAIMVAEAVRRALAVQLINSKEFGLLANENPLQGSAFTPCTQRITPLTFRRAT